MTQEIEMLKLLLEGQKDISEQIKRVHKRLDRISDLALKNEQSVMHLEKMFDTEKAENKEKFDIAHKSIRRRDGHLKWIITAIIVPIALSIMAFLNVHPK